MTRKDYEIVAAALRDARRSWGDRIPTGVLIECLSERFLADNAAFDATRFVRAVMQDADDRVKATRKRVTSN